VLNPELGNEHKGLPEKTATPKKIAVVGAGPAGLEAAIYAAQIGHTVTVFEKEAKAGGQLYLAAIPPGKEEITPFIRWQLTQAKKLGVEIKYNTDISADFFSGNQFDQIIVATGASPAQPPIPGADLPHVVTAHDVLAGKCNVGYNVVVIGGGQVGAETANHLAVYLKGVTLVEMQSAIAADEALAPRWHLLRSLDNRKVRVITDATVEGIKAETIIIKTADGKMELPCDSVVMATGSVSNNELANQLSEKGLNVKVIGDAGKVGGILDATEQGYQVALSI